MFTIQCTRSHMENQIFVLRTDASSSGWGAEFNGTTTGGRWNEHELPLHINKQELLEMLFALESIIKKWLKLISKYYLTTLLLYVT